ncbi:EAL domain-containing protein [Ilumatobacter sp.]|uniref:EAL domain-containing protein n=1 Tax=Ilumatobacter sp. TaxID=1967498 RepID=UPI003B51A362
MTSPDVVADVELDSGVDWGRLVASALHDDDRLTSVFQPIIDVERAAVVGYEALTRFTHPDTPDVGPDRWFAQAARLGVGAELEARALAASLAHRSSMPRNCFLTVNVDPGYLLEPSVRGVLASHPMSRGLVIEFTEHRSWDWELVASSVQMLRSSGALIAIDDAGSGYSGLQQILRLRPSILKLDRSLVESIDQDEAKASLVEMMGVFASRIDAGRPTWSLLTTYLR